MPEAAREGAEGTIENCHSVPQPEGCVLSLLATCQAAVVAPSGFAPLCFNPKVVFLLYLGLRVRVGSCSCTFRLCTFVPQPKVVPCVLSLLASL